MCLVHGAIGPLSVWASLKQDFTLSVSVWLTQQAYRQFSSACLSKLQSSLHFTERTHTYTQTSVRLGYPHASPSPKREAAEDLYLDKRCQNTSIEKLSRISTAYSARQNKKRDLFHHSAFLSILNINVCHFTILPLFIYLKGRCRKWGLVCSAALTSVCGSSHDFSSYSALVMLTLCFCSVCMSTVCLLVPCPDFVTITSGIDLYVCQHFTSPVCVSAFYFPPVQCNFSVVHWHCCAFCLTLCKYAHNGTNYNGTISEFAHAELVYIYRPNIVCTYRPDVSALNR